MEEYNQKLPGDSVAKNTTYYTLALIVQKILAFVYFFLNKINEPYRQNRQAARREDQN